MRQGLFFTIRYRSLMMAAMSAIVAGTSPLYAQTERPKNVPSPDSRPELSSSDSNNAINSILQQSGSELLDAITSAFTAKPDDPTKADPLTSGFDALSSNNIGQAISIRNQLPQTSLDRKILTWSIATSGNNSIPSSELRRALQDLKSWPSQSTINNALERAIVRENSSPMQLINHFEQSPPRTIEGIRGLALAYLQSNQKDKAAALLKSWWPEARLSPLEEKQFIADFADILTLDDHRARLITALYANRLESAEALAIASQGRSLIDAYQAVNKNAADAGKQISELDPSWQEQSIYQYMQIRNLRLNNRLTDAAELMLHAPKDKNSLVNPDAWWNERRILSRDLLDIGKADLAYKIVSEHAAETPWMAADAEFHAGWYALRMLKKPELAAEHFRNLENISRSGQSLSRAFYWQARAAEVNSDENAEALFKKAAQFKTSFYGQLASAHLGEQTGDLPYPHASEDDKAAFDNKEVVKAIKRLEAKGFNGRAISLYHGLAQQIDKPEELALLTDMAQRNSNHYLALRMAKNAAGRGIDVGALTHPIGVIPNNTELGEAGLALAYAIARQESEFNTGAVSHAGALGLLQLMPQTAKAVATRAGLDYSQQKLTSDASYNATLGTHYLSEQLKRFGGSYILTAAAYNAGPARVNEWIKRYGDPKGKSVEEVIDWIERIPYPETRNYVQRVLENYEVYRQRLNGQSDIVDALRFGRRAS